MDAFEDGFLAGFRRGYAVGQHQLAAEVKAVIPHRDEPIATDYGAHRRPLKDELLERERARRDQPQSA